VLQVLTAVVVKTGVGYAGQGDHVLGWQQLGYFGNQVGLSAAARALNKRM
jgi:hypothetical protein